MAIIIKHFASLVLSATEEYCDKDRLARSHFLAIHACFVGGIAPEVLVLQERLLVIFAGARNVVFETRETT